MSLFKQIISAIHITFTSMMMAREIYFLKRRKNLTFYIFIPICKKKKKKLVAGKKKQIVFFIDLNLIFCQQSHYRFQQ